MQGAPLYELDTLLLEAGDDVAPLVSGGQATCDQLRRIAERTRQMADADAWISDGVYFGWTRPLLDRADVIVCLDTPWQTAMLRIVSRHIKAEASRNNQFPGWRRLFRFLRWSHRYYRDANADRLDELGVPETRSRRMHELEAYRDKLVTCRTTSDAVRVTALRS